MVAVAEEANRITWEGDSIWSIKWLLSKKHTVSSVCRLPSSAMSRCSYSCLSFVMLKIKAELGLFLSSFLVGFRLFRHYSLIWVSVRGEVRWRNPTVSHIDHEKDRMARHPSSQPDQSNALTEGRMVMIIIRLRQTTHFHQVSHGASAITGKVRRCNPSSLLPPSSFAVSFMTSDDFRIPTVVRWIPTPSFDSILWQENIIFILPCFPPTAW